MGSGHISGGASSPLAIAVGGLAERKANFLANQA
jgi:hypothetical protein